MLVGGDYDTTGLATCGAATALEAVRAGLGTSLCQCRTKQDCLRWKMQLELFLASTPRCTPLVIKLQASNFPDIKTLDKYNRPTVSTDEELRNLRGLRNGWDQPFDEVKLLEVTARKFNYWGKGYMKWVGPVLLTKALVRGDTVVNGENIHFIKPVK